MDTNYKEIARTWTTTLNDILVQNTKNFYYSELSDWVKNCITCLQFAIDNETILQEKPSLYEDTIRTFGLLYSWLIEDKEWAYIELRQKFRTIYNAKQTGEALRNLLNKMQQSKEPDEDQLHNEFNNIGIDFRNKSFVDILYEMSNKWQNNTVQ